MALFKHTFNTCELLCNFIITLLTFNKVIQFKKESTGKFLGKLCKWSLLQRQPSGSVLRKRCSKNMQQIYRGTTTLKCDFNKVTLQLYWNRTWAWWVFSSKFAVYFQNTFSSRTLLKGYFWLLILQSMESSKQANKRVHRINDKGVN